jgi:predicted DNA-binding transcriptional regulator YafY
MAPDKLQLLVRAIQTRHCVAIRYYDQPEQRVVEPHAVYTADNGEIVVDAYQTSGYSSAGRLPPFWRPFRLKKITAVELLPEYFRARLKEGFMPHKPSYRRGLIAIVDQNGPAAHLPVAADDDTGPPPPGTRRRR